MGLAASSLPRTTSTREPSEVRDSRGNRLLTDLHTRIETGQDAHRAIDIELVTVEGEVTLGREPLAATL
jgi:hypothetical protein